MKFVLLRLAALGALVVVLTSACVYYNAMYDAGNAYDEGVDELQQGNGSRARLQFDSVIAKTDRILSRHPRSKWADDAALLKARSEINNKLWAAASESAARARQLSNSAKDSAVAMGLGGIAALNLERPGEADSLLSLALDGELKNDDRAAFLFNRGLARLELGLTSEAAADLQTAANEIDLTREARLELSRALRLIGQYERSAEVTVDVMMGVPFGALTRAERAQVDSLSVVAPGELEPRIAALLATSDIEPATRTMLETVEGMALEDLGERDSAVAILDVAATAGSTNRWAQEASLRAAMIRIGNARDPDQITQTIPGLESARLSPNAGIRDTASRMVRSAILFGEFTDAWEGRGSSAAEAALRAAELAGGDLQSPAVARGLYLKYLELAPDSPWAVKAIYGALAYAGHEPGDWVRDEGTVTDRALIAQLDAIPADNPYRLALDESTDDVWADSSYVLSEVDLQRRIMEIQMLFDTTIVRVQRDSVALDSTPTEEEPEDAGTPGSGGRILMGAPVRQWVDVRSIRKAAQETWWLEFEAPEIATRAEPGQFLMVGFGLTQVGAPFLPRPFSVGWRDSARGTVGLLIREFGAGTRRLARVQAGDQLLILGPFGRRFRVPPGRPVVCVGGGVGLAPFLFLAAEAHASGTEVTAAVRRAHRRPGVRSRADRGVDGRRSDRLHGGWNVRAGQGVVLDGIDLSDEPVLLGCGPTPMLNALERYARHADWISRYPSRSTWGAGSAHVRAASCAVRTAAG